jgi:hypothetical protein
MLNVPSRRAGFIPGIPLIAIAASGALSESPMEDGGLDGN